MHALGEERVVVAVGVGRDFAGAGHDAGLLEPLVVLQEEVGREHAHAAVDEFLEFGTDGAIGQAGGAFAGVIQPDDHFAGGLGRLEPVDGDFLAIGRVHERALGAEMGIAPLGARVCERDLARLGVRAADERLDRRTQDLLPTSVGLGERLQLLLGVGLQPLQQPAFELGVAGLRRRVGVVPDRQLLLRQRLIVAFDDRGLEAQLEVLVQQRVEARARHRVVVMREVFAALERHEVLLAVETVEFLEVRETLGRELLRPVVGGVHALGFRGEKRGDLDVAGIDAEQAGVLAGAAALHRGADHDDGVGEGHARVGRGEEHRLRAAAARARDGEAGRVDVGQAEHEVDAADEVERLQAHHALEVGFRLSAVEAPALGAVHLRALLGELVDDLGRELDRVGVAQGVDLPDHAAHAGELHAHRLEA